MINRLLEMINEEKIKFFNFILTNEKFTINKRNFK